MAQEIHQATEIVSISSSVYPKIRLGQDTVALEFPKQIEDIGEENWGNTTMPRVERVLLLGSVLLVLAPE